MVGITEDNGYSNLILDRFILTINPLTPLADGLEDSLKNSDVPNFRSKVGGFGMPELRIGVFDKETIKRGCLYTLRGEKEIEGFFEKYNGPRDFMGYIKEKWEEESRQPHWAD